jgi:hypothetical protein
MENVESTERFPPFPQPRLLLRTVFFAHEIHFDFVAPGF